VDAAPGHFDKPTASHPSQGADTVADLMLSSESFASTSITVAPVTDAGRTYLAERGLRVHLDRGVLSVELRKSAGLAFYADAAKRGLRVHLGWGIASARPGDILDEEGVNSSEIPKGCSPEEKR
tara:strand:- start:160 stop:531 length:372 start_codon:yes stop_codon:yes gene_type:complete